MKVGRKFRAKFADNDSKAAYMTYSAGQALVYNACAEEARYFDFFAYRYGETQQKALLSKLKSASTVRHF